MIVHGLPREFAAMVLGGYDADRTTALAVGLLGLFLIVAFHVVITAFSLRYRRRTQHLLGLMVDPFERVISRGFTSRQRYSRQDISPYHRVNGYPPVSAEYRRLRGSDFRDYRLHIGGLVERPVSLSLADLRALGMRSQVTKHNCIQGWTAVTEWAGVPLPDVLALVRPLPSARHLAVYAFDDKAETEGEGRQGHYYESIPLFLAAKPQALLALEMNGAPLPIEHGAPVRVRLETQLGFKMVRWVRATDGGCVELWVDGAYPLIELYSGDALGPPRRRRGLGTEPMTCPPNAFQSGEHLIRLQSDGSTTATWGVRLR